MASIAIGPLLGITTSLWLTVMTPDSSLPITTVPISLYFSKIGNLTGAFISRSGGFKFSKVSNRGSPLNHEQTSGLAFTLRFSPLMPEMGNQVRSLGRHPTCFKYGRSFSRHSSYLAFDHFPPGSKMVGSSILLINTIRERTPDVFASMACSLVCPPLSNPVSNSPFRAEITRSATSACDAPPIMWGTKFLWPGASRIVNFFDSVSNVARPHSSVLPLLRSCSVVSNAQAYFQLSLFLAFASRSNFSIVLSSTPPVRYKICPEIVDFPAST
mmetsp:Transcript_10830/g.15627  ORF Transcript_10830/g.15627 Transcript_10830/m.15627 type:complete len:271 (+) Transcript_10830:352-1164(+)